MKVILTFREIRVIKDVLEQQIYRYEKILTHENPENPEKFKIKIGSYKDILLKIREQQKEIMDDIRFKENLQKMNIKGDINVLIKNSK